MLQRLKIKFSRGYYRFKSYIGRPRLVMQQQPVILSETEMCENPIFLTGVHRSGTSLCRRIIDSHSRIACPPETYFLQHFALMIRDPHTFSGMQGMGFDREAALAEIKKWSARYHEAYRLAKGKPRWADKTPQYIYILPELEQLFGSAAQYVMIFRHSLDVIYSLFKRGWKLGDYHSDPLINTAMYVADSIKRQLSFAQQYPTRCFRLHYESLILDPEKTLQTMFKFLGEPWEPTVLDYNSFEHDFGTEDPVVRGTRGFIPNFGSWRAFSQKQLFTILPLVEGEMTALCYSLDGSEIPPSAVFR